MMPSVRCVRRLVLLAFVALAHAKQRAANNTSGYGFSDERAAIADKLVKNFIPYQWKSQPAPLGVIISMFFPWEALNNRLSGRLSLTDLDDTTLGKPGHLAIQPQKVASSNHAQRSNGFHHFSNRGSPAYHLFQPQARPGPYAAAASPHAKLNFRRHGESTWNKEGLFTGGVLKPMPTVRTIEPLIRWRYLRDPEAIKAAAQKVKDQTKIAVPR